METVTDAYGTKYQRIGETCYHVDTPQAVINVLEQARNSHQRVRLHYGDKDTGRDWHDEHDVEGYIGRSMGTIKIPLLVHNTRSMGGGAILDHRIVKISTSVGGYVLYQHPNYKPTKAEIKPSNEKGYTHSVYLDGELYANCHSEKQAQRLAQFMTK